MSIATLLAAQAAKAAKAIALLTTEQKNSILLAMADAIHQHQNAIITTNGIEVGNAQNGDYDDAFIDRLTLSAERVDAMVDGLRQVAALPDPVGQKRHLGKQPSGISVDKVRVPLGVICMIFEARPNVTADAAALCLKSGNAIILRGGKEALQTSLAIANIMRDVLVEFGLPKEAVIVVPDTDRQIMLELLQQRDTIDVVIPRGGEGLINFVTEHSKVPVIQHFKGVCHLYVDESAEPAQALELLLNGKVQRPGVCNALECLLVDESIAEKFLPLVANTLKELGVTVNSCARAAAYFEQANVLADDEFGEEYLRLEIAIKIVDNLNQAIEHIDRFGSKHTEVICTQSPEAAKAFQQQVDASVVMVNASSRFSDGGELGLGAEIGIATTKLHAYGPMGLDSLTTEKFLVNGSGQIRT
ncbi:MULTISPECIES: glutamate-5-semialdehyde dehydrogenase [Corallincola]|uniref:Gamma-glutamyl phosphate reductase n=3 Tax=Corallincola TaxID=1775176 RepID=A0A368N7D5_9GAMM|nr:MULTISPECIES: glutamate-5-semialdehyde dehydrogenase [Corallincola]RCU45435.1 glutamate-5-semialdehyde dehydrogenase [Corallincola holothuriorum]TAA41055.1 glutamate-5-semialdehyde dehydrogenase [Corallincola spongiicola]TCI02707.1 glutamate-5-semialdehyde dehydrogenase [Corallincola luteus]